MSCNPSPLFLLLLLLLTCLSSCHEKGYYIDAERGDDNHTGTSPRKAWKSVARINAQTFEPGDKIFFKRGTSYDRGVQINGDGTAEEPILITAFGKGDAPRFTNQDDQDLNGNCIQLNGDYQILENLYFHSTNPSSSMEFLSVWKLGGIKINLGADHCIVRNNEVEDCPIGINSYGEHTLITRNHVHDCNRPIWFPYWGPLGIRLGMGNQEVSWNEIHNYHSMGGEWGGDGGAIEIDDGRYPRNNIYIHHNKTSECMGFCEISYYFDICQRDTVDCLVENRIYDNIIVAYNESADYRTFTQFWAPLSNSFVENNTVYRKWEHPDIESNVFCENAEDSLAMESPTIYRNNLVVVKEAQTRRVKHNEEGLGNRIYFGNPLAPVKQDHNLYFNRDSSRLFFSPDEIENAALKVGSFLLNPRLENLDQGNYRPTPASPAIDRGNPEGHFDFDLEGNPIVGPRDIGAYEFQGGKITVNGGG